MKLRKHGVKRFNKADRGDLHAKFAVEIPRSVTPEQLELIQKFKDLEDEKNREVASSGSSQ